MGQKDESRNLDVNSPDEEDWEVQSNEVEVPFTGVELSRMASRVTSRVGVLSLDISNEQIEEERAQNSKFWIFGFLARDKITYTVCNSTQSSVCWSLGSYSLQESSSSKV